jgi:hypothetical protein
MQPIFLNQNYLVIGINKRTDADLTEYAKQRDSLMQTALTERKNQLFDEYLTSVKTRMEQAGKIKVYKDVLATMPRGRARSCPTATAASAGDTVEFWSALTCQRFGYESSYKSPHSKL